MRLALTYNQRRSDSEADAEFDTLETITMLTGILSSLGHAVTPVEVSGPVEELVATLRHLAPDLVFNIAEGRRGSFREAFFPALFEELGLRYTGSDARALCLCLDKGLTNRLAGQAGVLTPRGVHIGTREPAWTCESLTMPVIVKPNFEGSSKGITQSSVVSERAAVKTVVESLLLRYPQGVLVEEFVDGEDVSVAWFERIGLLPPIGYEYQPLGRYRILELELKKRPVELIRPRVPAAFDEPIVARLLEAAARAFRVLGVSGYGRADFRVTAAGEVYFLEMNPLPTLSAADNELYLAAERIGRTARDLLSAVVDAAEN
jgi:D-alanine-D-alanine ligase